MGEQPRTHQPTSVGCQLLFLVRFGLRIVRAISDQTDVGVSGALHAGLSFFGPPIAVPSNLPRGGVRPAKAGTGLTAFPCSTTISIG